MFQSKVIKKALLLDMLCKKIKDEIISEHPGQRKITIVLNKVIPLKMVLKLFE